MHKTTQFNVLITVLFATASVVHSGAPVQSLLPRVEDPRLDSALARSWRGIVARNIAPWTTGMVHRPYSEFPGDAVSEGQSYGMLVALYSNDQVTFDRIWMATERYMGVTSGGRTYYDWWRCADGGTDCNGPAFRNGPATDADQDIALALIFADSLVRAGRWRPSTLPDGTTYRQRAISVLRGIWELMIDQGRYLRPGNWGGANQLNVGYFAPSWYRVFAQWDPNPNHRWLDVVEQSYATLLATPGIERGLAPDWSAGDGSLLPTGPGYNTYANGGWMYKDAIRIHWRLAIDWLWFGERRAKRILDSAASFIREPARANFYQLDGTPVPVTDTFVLGSGLMRSRNERSHLTMGMWACAVFASRGPEAARVWADSLLVYLPDDSITWGRPGEPVQGPPTGSLPNEIYFDQFLAWFGASVLAGRFSNILADLADPLPGVAPEWVDLPPTSPVDLDLQNGALTLQASLNKPASWNVRLISQVDGSMASFAGTSAQVEIIWNGMANDGDPFPLGWVEALLELRGEPAVRRWVWLGRHRDLRVDGSWLLIDDFADRDIIPWFGSWGTFGNGHLGGSGRVDSMAVRGQGSDQALRWHYNLGTGGFQFTGVQWNRSGWAGLDHVSDIRYQARASHPTVIDLHLLQSDIGDDNYFHRLDTVGTTWRTFAGPLSGWRGRLGSRSGTPDLTRGSAFHWHVQQDRCIQPSGPCTQGWVEIRNVQMAGNLSRMTTVLEGDLPMPSDVPFDVGVDRNNAQTLPLRLDGSRLHLRLPEAASLVIRDAAGRSLLRRDLSVGPTIVDLQGLSGILFLNVRGPGLNWSDRLVLTP